MELTGCHATPNTSALRPLSAFVDSPVFAFQMIKVLSAEAGTMKDPSQGSLCRAPPILLPRDEEDRLEARVKPQVKAALRLALRRASECLDRRGGQFCLLSADLVREESRMDAL